MIGLVRPDTGQILIRGVSISRENIIPIRRSVGYVVQDGGLFPHLTARDNALIMARHLGWGEKKCERRLEELAGLTSLRSELLGLYPLQLSGGQRQRVSLIRALMLDPDVLLLDEPMASLDPMIRSDLQLDLRQIFRALKKTVVLVTHDLGEAAFLGDNIVLMLKGRILQSGKLSELLETPAHEFVSQFIHAQRTLHFSPTE